MSKNGLNSIVTLPKMLFVIFGSLVCGPLMASSIAELGERIRQANEVLKESNEKLEDLRDKADPEDFEIIDAYYRDNQLKYLQRPLRSQMSDVSQLLRQFVTKSEALVAQRSSGAFESKSKNANDNSFSTCLRDEGQKDFIDAGKDISKNFASIFGGLDTSSRSGSHSQSRSRSRQSDMFLVANRELSSQTLVENMEILDRGLGPAWLKCCGGSNLKENKEGKEDPEFCSKVAAELEQLKSETEEKISKRLPEITDMPDPLRFSSLSSAELAYLLKNPIVQDHLNSIFRRSDLAESANREERYLIDTQNSCEQELAEQQRRAAPWRFFKKIKPALDLAACEGLSSYMVMKQSRNAAKTTMAIMGTLGQTGLIDCNPQTMAALDSTLESYSRNNVATIDQIANAFHINKYRNYTPIVNPGSYITLNNGTLVGPNFVAGSPTPESIRSNSRTNVIAGVPTYVQSSAPVLTGRRGATPSIRREAAGTEFVKGVRSLSSKIDQGQNSAQIARALKSGAQKTRKFFSSSLSSKKSGGKTALSLRKKSAVKVKNAAQNLAQTKSRRLMAQNILNKFSARGRGEGGERFRVKNQPSANSGARARLGSISNVFNRANDVRQSNIAAAKAINAQMETITNKANEALAKLRALIQERDRLSIQTRNKVDDGDMDPDEQAELVDQYLKKIEQLDSQMAPYALAVDMSRGALLESQSLLSTISTFPGNNINVPRPVPSLGTKDSQFPKGFQANRENMSFLETGPFKKIWNFLDPISQAFAAVAEDDKWWLEEWYRFVNEYAVYVKQKQKDEGEALKEAWSLYKTEIDRIDTLDLSPTAIEVAEMTMQSTFEESSELLKARLRGKEIDASSVNGNFLFELREARDESKKAMEAIKDYKLALAKDYPETVDENLSLWVSQIPLLGLSSDSP